MLPFFFLLSLFTLASSFFLSFFSCRLDPSYVENTGAPSDYSPLFAQGILLAPTLLHPNQRGEVRLRDGNHLTDPVIELEVAKDEDDVRRMVMAIRQAQLILKAPAMRDKHEPEVLFHRQLAEELGEDTDEYWKEFLRLFASFVYHPACSCKMGRKGDTESSVVGPDLKVHGVNNLRVADASVMPFIPSANTNVPTAAVAENAAEMILGERRGGGGQEK